MTEHKPKYVWHEGDGAEEVCVRCERCGQTSGWLPTRQECEDWWLKHEQYIERVRANLGRHQPALATVLRHYQEMAKDRHLSPEHRDQFQALADELKHRIDPEPTSEDQFLPGF